jgi:hypothetical protein
MLFKEIITVYTEKRKETHKYKMHCYWLLKRARHIFTTGLWRVKAVLGHVHIFMFVLLPLWYEGGGGLDLYSSGVGPVTDCYEYSNEPSDSIKDE